MAIQIGDLLSGRLGDKIYSIDPVTKKQVVRSCPKKVRYPNTEAQQAHKGRFLAIVRLSSCMTEAHAVGLRYHARRAKLRTYMDFRRLNKDCFTAEGEVDYPRIVLSRGPLCDAEVLSVGVERGVDEGSAGRVTVRFDNGLYASNAAFDDECYLYAFHAGEGEGVLSEPALREGGVVAVEVPAGWLEAVEGDEGAPQRGLRGLHLYIFFRNRAGRTSESRHVPLPAGA